MGIRFLNDPENPTGEGVVTDEPADNDTEPTVDEAQAADDDTEGNEEKPADSEAEVTEAEKPNPDAPDPDVLPDSEKVTNLGELRKVRTRNKNLKARLDAAIKERDEIKASGSSEDDKKLISELQTKLAEYETKESEVSKKQALTEAGFPESYVAILKGSEEEWKETLRIMSEEKPSNPNNTNRITADEATNGIPTNSNIGTLQEARSLRGRRR